MLAQQKGRNFAAQTIHWMRSHSTAMRCFPRLAKRAVMKADRPTLARETKQQIIKRKLSASSLDAFASQNPTNKQKVMSSTWMFWHWEKTPDVCRNSRWSNSWAGKVSGNCTVVIVTNYSFHTFNRSRPHTDSTPFQNSSEHINMQINPELRSTAQVYSKSEHLITSKTWPSHLRRSFEMKDRRKPVSS